MDNERCHSELAELLHTEHNAIKCFLELLEREQELLIQGNAAELLDKISAEKQQNAEYLTDLGNKREQYLFKERLTLDELTSNKIDSNLELIWKNILQLAKTAKRLNQINGTLITSQLHQSQQTLAALQRAAGTVSLYGPKGQAVPIQS